MTAVRLILAMYLAIWSPAMCCCAIKSALGASGCEERSRLCCARNISTLNHCCDTNVPASSVCCAGEDHLSGTSDESRCRCHEKSIDRLDTGSKAIEFSLAVNHFGLLIEHATGACASTDHRQVDLASRWHPPPSNSLFLQRCLLLI